MAIATLGCAGGVPVGARSSDIAVGPRSFARAAVPKYVPGPEGEEGTGRRSTSIATAASTLTVSSPHRAREEVLAAARSQVGRTKIVIGGVRQRDDCTGLVAGAYGLAGIDLLSEAEPGDNAVSAIWRYAQRHGRIFRGGWPMPGDLVFFRDTYDRNRDGRINDALTHVAIVDDVDRDGTATIIHHVSRGVVVSRMNLAWPRSRHDGHGRVINDLLRVPGPGRRELLTAELFMGYATVFPVGPSIAAR